MHINPDLYGSHQAINFSVLLYLVYTIESTMNIVDSIIATRNRGSVLETDLLKGG